MGCQALSYSIIVPAAKLRSRGRLVPGIKRPTQTMQEDVSKSVQKNHQQSKIKQQKKPGHFVRQWWSCLKSQHSGREAGRSLWVRGQPNGLQNELQDSQDYTETPCLLKQKINQNKNLTSKQQQNLTILKSLFVAPLRPVVTQAGCFDRLASAFEVVDCRCVLMPTVSSQPF